MSRLKIIIFSLLIIVCISSSCFVKADSLKFYEENKTISINEVQEYKENITDEIIIDDVKYQLEDITENENKITLTKEKEDIEQLVVKTNNKYDALSSFETKKDYVEDGYIGKLELQIDSLEIKPNDSYIEQYKVEIIKQYEDVSSNELNDVPKIIEEGNTTYYLVNPVWKVSKTQLIDGQYIPLTYNGEMHYEGVKERTIIKSYIATITYKGVLEKEVVDSITFNIKYKEVQENNYIAPAVATASGIIIFSGILIFKRKNVSIYNNQHGQWKLIKKVRISKNNKLIDVTPIVPLKNKYKIKLNNKIFKELINTNVTVKYYDKTFIYEVKNQEFEIFV